MPNLHSKPFLDHFWSFFHIQTLRQSAKSKFLLYGMMWTVICCFKGVFWLNEGPELNLCFCFFIICTVTKAVVYYLKLYAVSRIVLFVWTPLQSFSITTPSKILFTSQKQCLSSVTRTSRTVLVSSLRFPSCHFGLLKQFFPVPVAEL